MSEKRDDLFGSESSEEEPAIQQPPAAEDDEEHEQGQEPTAKDQPLVYDRPDYKDVVKSLEESLELKQRGGDAFSKKNWDAVAEDSPRRSRSTRRVRRSVRTIRQTCSRSSTRTFRSVS